MYKISSIFLLIMLITASIKVYSSTEQQFSIPPAYTSKNIMPCQGFERYSTFRRSPSPDQTSQYTMDNSITGNSPMETTQITDRSASITSDLRGNSPEYLIDSISDLPVITQSDEEIEQHLAQLIEKIKTRMLTKNQ